MNNEETETDSGPSDRPGGASVPSERLGPMPARDEGEALDPVRARAAGRPLDENVDAAILDTAWRLLLEGFRRGMLQPRLADIVAALERGKERGEVRRDLDSEVAVHALMGAFMYHRIAEGQPKKGWPEHVVDQLWPAFAV